MYVTWKIKKEKPNQSIQLQNGMQNKLTNVKFGF